MNICVRQIWGVTTTNDGSASDFRDRAIHFEVFARARGAASSNWVDASPPTTRTRYLLTGREQGLAQRAGVGWVLLREVRGTDERRADANRAWSFFSRTSPGRSAGSGRWWPGMPCVYLGQTRRQLLVNECGTNRWTDFAHGAEDTHVLSTIEIHSPLPRPPRHAGADIKAPTTVSRRRAIRPWLLRQTRSLSGQGWPSSPRPQHGNATGTPTRHFW